MWSALEKVDRQLNRTKKGVLAMLELMIGPRSPWTIFDELESLQDNMNRLLAGQEPRVERRAGAAYPPLNVYSTADGLTLVAEMPGVDPQDVEISVDGDELALRGKVNSAAPAAGETVLRRERPAGEFQRTLQLPFRAHAAGVKATFKNGLLNIAVPRSPEEKPRKIAITAE